jgi:hypothetical protein
MMTATGLPGKCYSAHELNIPIRALKRYLAEFNFRYNERVFLGVNDKARADRLVRGTVGMRLLCKDSSAASVPGQDN